MLSMLTVSIISNAINKLLSPKTSADTDQVHVSRQRENKPIAIKLLPTQFVNLFTKTQEIQSTHYRLITHDDALHIHIKQQK